VATDEYSQGNAGKGEQIVKDLTGYVQQAGDDAQKNHKKIKQTEIELRKAERRLEDLKRSLDFDNQPPVQKAIDKIEDVRTQILKIMFE
jgi:chromosome segregation ATPase